MLGWGCGLAAVRRPFQANGAAAAVRFLVWGVGNRAPASFYAPQPACARNGMQPVESLDSKAHVGSIIDIDALQRAPARHRSSVFRRDALVQAAGSPSPRLVRFCSTCCHHTRLDRRILSRLFGTSLCTWTWTWRCNRCAAGAVANCAAWGQPITAGARVAILCRCGI